jgi:hypothetical protein
VAIARTHVPGNILPALLLIVTLPCYNLKKIALLREVMPPTIKTIGNSLYWCYANLAMAHSALTKQSSSYGKTHFIIRSKLYTGLQNASMNLGSIADDERLKMILPQVCNYCGAKTKLSIDHLIPRAKGGADKAENMVWACKSCNSAKSDTDLLDWYQAKEMFPPLLLLRRYLKIAIEFCRESELMEVNISDAPELPFNLNSIPHNFPKPTELKLWIVPLE